jgi:hypothetical protein
MGSDAGLERLELEEELGIEIERIMLARLSEPEARHDLARSVVALVAAAQRIEVSSLAEAVAKELLEAGWRRR